MKPIVTEGPALLAAAAAVRTNRPAPMMAPMPRPTRSNAPSVRLRPWWPSASARSCVTDLIANSGLAISPLPVRVAGRRAKHRDRSVDHDADDQPLHGGERQLFHDERRDQDRGRARDRQAEGRAQVVAPRTHEPD